MVAECELKSPSVLLCPLFQRGNFLRGLLTPPFEGLRAGFGKGCPQSFGFAQDKLRRREGKGRFFGRNRGAELCGELQLQDARFQFRTILV